MAVQKSNESFPIHPLHTARIVSAKYRDDYKTSWKEAIVGRITFVFNYLPHNRVTNKKQS